MPGPPAVEGAGAASLKHLKQEEKHNAPSKKTKGVLGPMHVVGPVRGLAGMVLGIDGCVGV